MPIKNFTTTGTQFSIVYDSLPQGTWDRLDELDSKYDVDVRDSSATLSLRNPGFSDTLKSSDTLQVNGVELTGTFREKMEALKNVVLYKAGPGSALPTEYPATYAAMQASITADPTTKRDFFVTGEGVWYRYSGSGSPLSMGGGAVVAYQHPRGDTEMNGDTTYGNPTIYGLGFYEQMTADISFNYISIPIYATSVNTVVVRVYKSSSVPSGTFNPSTAFAFLEEVSYATGVFNTQSGSKQNIQLVNTYNISAGEYVVVLVCGNVVSASQDLMMKKWSVDSGTAPFRHKFYHK